MTSRQYAHRTRALASGKARVKLDVLLDLVEAEAWADAVARHGSAKKALAALLKTERTTAERIKALAAELGA